MIPYLIYLFATPALVMLLARRWTWIDKVSPMAVLYIIGLLVANLTPWIRQPGLLDTNNLIGSVCIPLSIPLMLMSCSLSRVSFDNTFKAFLCGFGAILVVTVAGFFLFRHHTDPTQFAKISAVAVGIYTGGIPNMGAIAQGVGMDNTTYLYITSYDLIVTGLYLVFVVCFPPASKSKAPLHQRPTRPLPSPHVATSSPHSYWHWPSLWAPGCSPPCSPKDSPPPC